MFSPQLASVDSEGVHLLEDRGARALGVLVAFGDRRGGTSAPPYDTLNLALRSADDPGSVEENRRRAARAAGFDPSALALARQVHGTHIVEANPGDSGVVGEADGLMVRRPGSVVGILTADCTPVVVAGEAGIAILHAGWRGLAGGIVEKGVGKVGDAWAAWVGPAIRACCYRVGPEVVEAFSARGLPVAAEGRVDPSDAAVAMLRACGVERVARADVCTKCDTNYFSYRRDGVTGRQGAFAGLLASTS
ncbi:MAG TPA: polyphenol oxidase family protein [Actinomycetota bacterium]|nr:polyphenol oxidase family protein [Actinomycetota bacterium]